MCACVWEWAWERRQRDMTRSRRLVRVFCLNRVGIHFMQFFFSDAEAETVGNYIYLLGGSITFANGSFAVVNWNERYDVAGRVWTTLAPMPTARYTSSFQIKSHRWFLLPSSRARFATEVSGGKIYVFGGRDSTDTLINSVEAFDVSAGTWSTISTTLPTPRSDMSAASLANGHMILVGGYDQVCVCLWRFAGVFCLCTYVVRYTCFNVSSHSVCFANASLGLQHPGADGALRPRQERVEFLWAS